MNMHIYAHVHMHTHVHIYTSHIHIPSYLLYIILTVLEGRFLLVLYAEVQLASRQYPSASVTSLLFPTEVNVPSLSQAQPG